MIGKVSWIVKVIVHISVGDRVANVQTMTLTSNVSHFSPHDTAEIRRLEPSSLGAWSTVRPLPVGLWGTWIVSGCSGSFAKLWAACYNACKDKDGNWSLIGRVKGPIIKVWERPDPVDWEVRKITIVIWLCTLVAIMSNKSNWCFVCSHSRHRNCQASPCCRMGINY